jgi:hypothetical protein
MSEALNYIQPSIAIEFIRSPRESPCSSKENIIYYAGFVIPSSGAGACTWSTRFTIMIPVIMDEKASMRALAAMTAFRAEESTPVNSDTTTNMLRGTRNNEDS